jgi:thymidylate synthase
LEAKISKAIGEELDLRFDLQAAQDDLTQLKEHHEQLMLDMEHEAGVLQQNNEPVDDAFGNEWGKALMESEEEIDKQHAVVKETKKKYDDMNALIAKWEDRLYA